MGLRCPWSEDKKECAILMGAPDCAMLEEDSDRSYYSFKCNHYKEIRKMPHSWFRKNKYIHSKTWRAIKRDVGNVLTTMRLCGDLGKEVELIIKQNFIGLKIFDYDAQPFVFPRKVGSNYICARLADQNWHVDSYSPIISAVRQAHDTEVAMLVILIIIKCHLRGKMIITSSELRQARMVYNDPPDFPVILSDNWQFVKEKMMELGYDIEFGHVKVMLNRKTIEDGKLHGDDRYETHPGVLKVTKRP